MSEETIQSFSLSPQQRHAWLLSAEAPPKTFGVVELAGNVEPERVAAALEALRERFEILRTGFGVLPGTSTPVQSPRTCAEVPFALEREDLTGLDEARYEARLDDLRAAFEATPFDLESGAVLHASLVATAADRALLFLAFPLLAGDALSVDALTEALAEELGGAPAGSGASGDAGDDEDEGVMQYADVAQWLHELFESEEAEEGQRPWRRLDTRDGDPGPLPGELRLENDDAPARPAVQRFAVPAELRGALERLVEARDVAPAALLGAAATLVLSRWTDRAALVLGYGAAGRSYEGLAQTPGSFWKSVPLALRVETADTLARFLEQVDHACAEADEGQEFYDPERLGEAGRLPANALGFAWLPACEAQAGDVTLRVLERSGAPDPHRLRVVGEEVGEDLVLRVEHDAARVPAETAQRLGEQLLALLESITSASPDARLGELSMTSAAARETLTGELARGPAANAPHATIVHWIAAQAASTPEAPAVATHGGALDYGELDAASNRLARHLQARGVAPGDFVGIHLDRCPELMTSILAVMKAGGAYVPLPHGYPADRLAFMAQDSGLATVLTRSDLAADLEGPELVLLDREAQALDALDASPLDLDANARREGPAYVIYTSGSTGVPKGVVITHENLVHSTGARPVSYGAGPGTYLVLSSVAFDSSVPGLFWTLAEGGRVLFPRDGFEEELASLPALIARERVTHMLGLPSLYGVILESAAPGELDSLDTVIVAGEAATTALVDKHFETLPKTRLFDEYGPTEATVWGSVHDCAERRGGQRVPIGRPIPGGACYVLDEARAPVPVGVPGELWLGGHGIAAGYHAREELTAERFLPDPFDAQGLGDGARMYRTGDLVRWLPTGELEFLGRVDSQVKIRGYRIELEEIESALEAHPRVREAALAARVDSGGVGTLAAFVVAEGDVDAEAELVEEVRASLETRLPDYMMPASLALLPELPRLPNGKVDRARLPEEGGAELAAKTPYAEPETPLERLLARVWAEVLGKERVGRNDDFFALGGHSIVATRLYARMRDTLQVELPLRVLFDKSTVAELAQVILADESQRARVERTAELLEQFEGVSDEELEEKLGG